MPPPEVTRETAETWDPVVPPGLAAYGFVQFAVALAASFLLLLNAERMPLAQACFDFLPARARLDIAGWADKVHGETLPLSQVNDVAERCGFEVRSGGESCCRPGTRAEVAGGEPTRGRLLQQEGRGHPASSGR